MSVCYLHDGVYAGLLYMHVFSLFGRPGNLSHRQPPGGSRERDADANEQMMEIKKEKTERAANRK